MLEGDLWLDSLTGDVYRATDPWSKDGTWNEWGTVLWKAADNVLMVQPADGDTGTTGEPTDFGPYQGAPWASIRNNPSMASITSVRSKGGIAVNANNTALFSGYASLTDLSAISNWNVSSVTNMFGMFSDCTSLTNLSPLSGWDASNVTGMERMFYHCTSLANISALSGWDVSGVTSMKTMFSNCTSLTDLSALSGWDTSGVTNMFVMFNGCKSLTDISPISDWNVSGVTSMAYMFYNCPLERIGVPSLDHGGRNFVSNLKTANAVSNMDATMLTNTTTHEPMSANQILADMDSNPSKYATGTVWTL